MPYPLTVGILLFLHLCAPMLLEAPGHFPVSRHSAALWLPSPPFHGSLIRTDDQWLPFCYIQSRLIFGPLLPSLWAAFDSPVCEVLSSLRFQGISLFRFSKSCPFQVWSHAYLQCFTFPHHHISASSAGLKFLPFCPSPLRASLCLWSCLLRTVLWPWEWSSQIWFFLCLGFFSSLPQF